MTMEEAKADQEDVAKHFKLGWWFGVHCDKCCGVYPRLHTSEGFDGLCWYECDVCGKRTVKASMPWIAEREWNDERYEYGGAVPLF